MHNKYTILRLQKQTVRRLKVLAATQRMSMIALVDRLVTAECERVRLPREAYEPTQAPQEA